MRSLDAGSAGWTGMGSEWESMVDATLRGLGVSVPQRVYNRDVALALGFAVASVSCGQRALQERDPDAAIGALEGAVLSLQRRRHMDLGQLLAVAHYLRGTAYEAKRLAGRARDDYAMALVLAPDHEGARAAHGRVVSGRTDDLPAESPARLVVNPTTRRQRRGQK
jgi:hypothetical protein